MTGVTQFDLYLLGFNFHSLLIHLYVGLAALYAGTAIPHADGSSILRSRDCRGLCSALGIGCGLVSRGSAGAGICVIGLAVATGDYGEDDRGRHKQR